MKMTEEEEFRETNKNSILPYKECIKKIFEFAEKRNLMEVFMKFVHTGTPNLYSTFVYDVYKDELGFYANHHAENFYENEMIEQGYEIKLLTRQEISNFIEIKQKQRDEHIIKCRWCLTEIMHKDYKGGCEVCNERAKKLPAAKRISEKPPTIIVNPCKYHNNQLIGKGANCPLCEKEEIK